MAGEDHFDLTDSATSFTITMETDDDQVESLVDPYSYTVKAVALGDAFMEISGTMDIKKVCLADLVDTFNKDIRFELPDVGSDTDN
jgi:hypothetical protein